MGMPNKREPAPNPTSRAILAEIRAELARRKMHQKDLAQRMSRGPNYLSKKLRETGSLTTTDLVEICEAFEIDLIEFLRHALDNREAQIAADAERRLRERGRTDQPPDQNG
jgi:transcriptional regulator with XRE-family HTH domain